MYTWTFKISFAALAAVAGLAACTEAPDVTAAGFGFARTAPQTIAVANRSVVIGGPPGYCVDRPGSKLGGDTAFVVLASCASIASDPELGRPGAFGLLTASVDKEEAGGPGFLSAPEALEALLTSESGRAALARDGRADSVQILDMSRQDDAILIRLRDSSQAQLAGVEDTYWRGLADFNGRLVTVSVVSFADSPLSEDQGLATLRAFLARIRAETPVRTAAN